MNSLSAITRTHDAFVAGRVSTRHIMSIAIVLAGVVESGAAFRAAVLRAPFSLDHELSSLCPPDSAGHEIPHLMVTRDAEIKRPPRIRAGALP